MVKLFSESIFFEFFDIKIIFSSINNFLYLLFYLFSVFYNILWQI